jgi:hypothetical protein
MPTEDEQLDDLWLKAIEEGATVTDTFKIPNPDYPLGVTNTMFQMLGFEEVAQLPFDPSGYSSMQLADLERLWEKDQWEKQVDANGEIVNYPTISIMKWTGKDADRAGATRRFIAQDSRGFGFGGAGGRSAISTALRVFLDGARRGGKVDGLPSESDGQADPVSLRKRAQAMARNAREFLDGIASANTQATRALLEPAGQGFSFLQGAGYAGQDRLRCGFQSPPSGFQSPTP